MPITLKIKIKTLVDEARHIRNEERSAAFEARKVRLWLRLQDAHFPEKKIDRILRRYLSVPRGAFTVDPEWAVAHDHRRDMMHQHRTMEVRTEARAAHLAYGFLRGRALQEMELYCYSPPPWKRTREIVMSHGRELAPDPQDNQGIVRRFDEWCSEAGWRFDQHKSKWVHPVRIRVGRPPHEREAFPAYEPGIADNVVNTQPS